jgi:hypothetical protein
MSIGVRRAVVEAGVVSGLRLFIALFCASRICNVDAHCNKYEGDSSCRAAFIFDPYWFPGSFLEKMLQNRIIVLAAALESSECVSRVFA